MGNREKFQFFEGPAVGRRLVGECLEGIWPQSWREPRKGGPAVLANAGRRRIARFVQGGGNPLGKALYI